MHYQLKILINSLGLILLFGCSEVDIYSDFDNDIDFSDYTTYTISEDLGVEYKNYPNYDNDFNRKRIKKAIEFEMNKRGYILDEINPELAAGFQIIIKDQQITIKNCSGIGMYDYWPQCWINTYNYTEGSLVIHVSDIKKNQVIWQGSAIAVLKYKPTKVKIEIDNIVKDIFKKYPLTTKINKPDDIYDSGEDDRVL